MSPLPIVERLDVAKMAVLARLPGLMVGLCQQSCFERTEKALHRGVVVAVNAPTHADPDPMRSQQRLIFLSTFG